MARVTVEDCILKVPNRFELALLASHRARGIASGSPITVERDNDKNPVIALREVAGESIDLENIQEDLITSMRQHHANEDSEEELESILSEEGDLYNEVLKELESGVSETNKIPAMEAAEEAQEEAGEVTEVSLEEIAEEIAEDEGEED